MSRRIELEVDRDVDRIASTRLDQDVLTEQSSLLHAEEHFYYFKYNSFEVPENIQVMKHEKQTSVAGIISLLLIGVFVANADGTIVLATNSAISSHFSQLEYASWLATSYMLAMCAAQPIVGKLSDLLGRKAVLLTCYAIFGFGTIISGLGQTLWQVIIGRAIAGIGGSGMTVIVSILITDLVPKIEIATWRSYVNVIATVGRSLGGPIGGWLADTIGWRWSFTSQVPLIGIAFVLVAWGLESSSSENSQTQDLGEEVASSKIGRIDFVGGILISSTIVSLLLAVDLSGQGKPWTSLSVLSLIMTCLVLGTTFLLFEAKYAREPIFPPRLLIKRDVATTYSIFGLQTAAQVAMMFSVPLYFQVTEGASNTKAGSHLVPAVLGNTVGGLLTGHIIRKTGKYKDLITIAAISTMASYTLLIFRWHGHTNIFESFYIIPGGLGLGIAAAATFIALTARIAPEDVAVATAGLYLAGNIGQVLGVSIGSSVQRWTLKALLVKRLEIPNGKEIIEHVLSDVSYVGQLEGALQETVVGSYVESLTYSQCFSLVYSAIALLVSFCIQEHPLVE